ncbi:MAG: EAL domain-containing protein [Deltaproteobacteria bacterium]|nr:MAG: EAL domain-containing protein [Deltaproteobacteria bacterium]
MTTFRHRISIFSQKLDRAAFVVYFLGGVVPLVALGVVVDRYALAPFAPERNAYSSAALIGVMVSTCALSLTCFFALRRMTRRSLQQIDRDSRQLASLFSATSSLAAAQHGYDVAHRAARCAVTLATAQAAFVLLRKEDEGALGPVAAAGEDCTELYNAVSEPLLELADLVVSEGRPALRGPEDAAAGGAGTEIGAAIVVPIPGARGSLGALAVIHADRRGRFDASQVDALCALAALCAVALRKARAVEENRVLAYYDTLTGLPNRRLYKDRLEQAILSARRRNRPVATCLLDLDGFKRVNDTLGHSCGDQLLCQVSERLVGTVRLTDSVSRLEASASSAAISRLGGDEFTFLLNDIADAQDAARVAARILDAFSKPFYVDGHEVFATASVGIAVFPFDGNDAETLLRNADAAMYSAKARGRNNFQFYAKSMNATALRKLDLEGRIRRALERQEFALHYQPVRDTLSGRLTGAEALLRWRDPELGNMSPAEFIPIAEETNLIGPLGEWVLRTACQQCHLWQSAGFRPIRLSVNLSGHQLRHRDLVDSVARGLRDSGLSPDWLELEITESTIMQNDDMTKSTFYALHDMGIGLALDDFGTGYSSLSYLRRFPLDRVKIDRSFVREITTNTDDAALAGAIIAMVHSLGLRVVAEGVETSEQAAFLRERGCDELQGFLFSPAVPADEFARFLDGETRR